MVDSIIFTATPTWVPRGSMRTMSPRHLSSNLPPGASNSTVKLIKFPRPYEASVSKNSPDALTSRVTPLALPKFTDRAVRTRRSPLLFSRSPLAISGTRRYSGNRLPSRVRTRVGKKSWFGWEDLRQSKGQIPRVVQEECPTQMQVYRLLDSANSNEAGGGFALRTRASSSRVYAKKQITPTGWQRRACRIWRSDDCVRYAR